MAKEKIEGEQSQFVLLTFHSFSYRDRRTCEICYLLPQALHLHPQLRNLTLRRSCALPGQVLDDLFIRSKCCSSSQVLPQHIDSIMELFE